MPSGAYFIQSCPTCGRTLQVRVEYLGKQVSCQHCSATFEACDGSSGDCPSLDATMQIMQRAEELLHKITPTPDLAAHQPALRQP